MNHPPKTILCHGTTPLGGIIMLSDGTSLLGLWFDDQKNINPALLKQPHTANALPVFQMTKSWLAEYFSGVIPHTTPHLAPAGTDFQIRVWRCLRTIPYGETVTYGELAKRLRTSSRAIGNAVSHNPISMIIPCHRVLGYNQELTGYAGGLERKRALLNLEQGHPML